MSTSSLPAAARPDAGHDQRPELRTLAERVAAMAIDAGADAAEVILGSGSERSVKVRKGEPELVHEAQSHGLGLRVFVDHRAAVTYSSDFTEAALLRLVRDTVEMSRLAEPSPYNELPERAELHPMSVPLPELDLWDDRVGALKAEFLIELAKEAEAAALQVSPKINHGDGATCDRSLGHMAFACADRQGLAFAGASRGTGHSLAIEVLCDDEGGKKRSGSYWTAGSFYDRLLSPAVVGQEAARRALGKLGAQKLKTTELPVVFDPDAARAMLRSVASVVSAGAIYRKSSYLVGRLDSQVASPLITIVDDPLLPRAPGSRPFDGDGLPVRKNVVVDGGVLKTYLYDTYSARQLGCKSNGCAGRGVGGSPYVTTSNFILTPGEQSPADILRGVEHGLYVTEMMGFGFNATTGDFSRGAAGFLIEKGELGAPVSEVTISANFDDILKRIDAIGNDLDRRSATMAPTLRVSRMMLAGR